MTDRLHVRIEGLVQGVGYRFFVRGLAADHGLNGFVRNLPDGRVEAAFEGPKATLEAVLAACQEGPHFSEVRNVEATWANGPSQYDSFDVTF